MFIVYETNDFYFFWKPHGLPSTFGKEKSFLDYLEEGIKDQRDKGLKNASNSFDLSAFQSFQKFIDSSLKEVQNTKSVIAHQTQIFSKTQEYGLLNRLDNDTQGFLYFAKDLPTYDKYKQLQAQNKVEKHYIAQVQGRFCPPFVKEGLQSSVAGDPKGGGFLIDYPIMHRSLEKMIAIKDAKDVKKGRGKEHKVETFVELLEYDKKFNISTLLVKIHKGIRHQIRVHLASIDFPIIGDPLYGESAKDEVLHLRSVGFIFAK